MRLATQKYNPNETKNQIASTVDTFADHEQRHERTREAESDRIAKAVDQRRIVLRRDVAFVDLFRCL